jgi:isoleucyl-tRNA synthetase
MSSVLERRTELAKPPICTGGHRPARGWFQASLLTGCAIDGRAPYPQLLTQRLRDRRQAAR